MCGSCRKERTCQAKDKEREGCTRETCQSSSTRGIKSQAQTWGYQEKKKKVTEEEKEKEITDDQKLKLRERLKDVRKAHHAALGGATVTHHVPSGSEEDGPDGEEDASTDYAPIQSP